MPGANPKQLADAQRALFEIRKAEEEAEAAILAEERKQEKEAKIAQREKERQLMAEIEVLKSLKIELEEKNEALQNSNDKLHERFIGARMGARHAGRKNTQLHTTVASLKSTLESERSGAQTALKQEHEQLAYAKIHIDELNVQILALHEALEQLVGKTHQAQVASETTAAVSGATAAVALMEINRLRGEGILREKVLLQRAQAAEALLADALERANVAEALTADALRRAQAAEAWLAEAQTQGDNYEAVIFGSTTAFASNRATFFSPPPRTAEQSMMEEVARELGEIPPEAKVATPLVSTTGSTPITHDPYSNPFSKWT